MRFLRYLFSAATWVAVLVTIVGQVQAEIVSGALYAVNSGSGGQFLMTLDKTTGAVTTIGNTGLTIDGMTIGPNGVMYAADNSNNRLVTLNPMTGALDTVIGNTGVSSLEGLAARPGDGALFGINLSSDELMSLNPITGEANSVGGFGTSDNLAGLTFSNDSSTLYAMGHTSGTLYSINQNTGAATAVGNSGQTSGALGLAIDRETGSLYMADWTGGDNMQLYTINPNNAAATFVGTTVGALQIEGMSFAPFFPEPTLVLVDIKPGPSNNTVPLNGNGTLQMAILANGDFDVLDVDIASLLFGDPILVDGGATALGATSDRLRDLNHDGLDDLLVGFSISDLVAGGALAASSVEGRLTGELLDGTPIFGSDIVRMVPQNNGGGGLVISAVPEPTTSALALAALCLAISRRRSF